jgi:hypothetical protein
MKESQPKHANQDDQHAQDCSASNKNPTGSRQLPLLGRAANARFCLQRHYIRPSNHRVSRDRHMTTAFGCFTPNAPAVQIFMPVEQIVRSGRVCRYIPAIL